MDIRGSVEAIFICINALKLYKVRRYEHIQFTRSDTLRKVNKYLKKCLNMHEKFHV